MILMILMPATFMVNPSVDIKSITTNINIVSTIFTEERPSMTDPIQQKNADNVLFESAKISSLLTDGVLTLDEKKLYRTDLDSLRASAAYFSNTDNSAIKTTVSHIEALANTTDYVPWWIIVLVSLAIGAGTLVGWKRIVKTI